MSDVMRVQAFEALLEWILEEYREKQSIFGIHESLFYDERAGAPFATEMFGHRLSTPIGPGAGPHTQMTQNILAAWLSGGRFIELKTVQVMDELDIGRPCIDMADEGYNVEWSQELKLEESALEYVKAWVLIHVLRRLLGREDEIPFGTIFNMSVGYDLAGIKSEPMLRFMDRMEDASQGIAELQTVLDERFPTFADLDIPTRIVDSVTLSTMHGCPPDEIEQISRYLLDERKLHTFVKLNPTLLGKERVMEILHGTLGFEEILIEDRVFEHDLQYDRAVELISALKDLADGRDLTFGVKLSNTLAMTNHRDVLPGEEMYMSGRALYPITMDLFRKLVLEFDGDLNVSYAGGADALNVTSLLSCGALPVTSVSDLLKPGGYSRFLQYLENLENGMAEAGAGSLAELSSDAVENLEQAASGSMADQRYRKSYHPYELPKVTSGLDLFDCIDAPCRQQCAILQNVPEYAWLIAEGHYDQALDVILYRNPLPNVTGYVCDHLCQTRCTRSNYDDPVAIRALKRFAAEKGSAALEALDRTSHEVAIVGAGPSGLAAAYFLALSGVKPVLFEAREKAGGMLAIAADFRLPDDVVQRDITRVLDLGAELRLGHRVTESPEALLEQGFDAVYLACGHQADAHLGIEGEESEGVYHALDFLGRVARGEDVSVGQEVLVIGGGNTAMDAARTARRLTDGSVKVVYRRTEDQMPADREEIDAIFDEEIELEDLASPMCVVPSKNGVRALTCRRNELGEPGEDGRPRPVPLEGSEFDVEADTIIVAIGQRPEVSLLDGSTLALTDRGRMAVDFDSGLTSAERVYAGGDLVRGPATIVKACADGQRAAEAICDSLEVDFRRPEVELPILSEEEILSVKRIRAQRIPQHASPALPVGKRKDFELVEQTFSEDVAVDEARRCLQCSQFCDKCVEVCPNRANYTFMVTPRALEVPRLSYDGGRLVARGSQRLRVTQPRQIIHVEDLCNDCGNCATFCVHKGRPYQDKPRLFLNSADFEREEDNAFLCEQDNGGWRIRRREGGAESRLWMGDGELLFENEEVRVRTNLDFELTSAEAVNGSGHTLSLIPMAEMFTILEGVLSSAAFLVSGSAGTGE
jgi:putative selenate reductase